MDAFAAFVAIMGTLALGTMSPGPSFLMVARTSIALSRADGIAAAFGMGIGGLAFGVLALLGLRAILTQVPWLYVALKLGGGLYLTYLAVRLWSGASQPLTLAAETGRSRAGLATSFGLGFATQVSNPKTAVVYASVFAALLPASPPAWLYAALPPLLLVMETGWYVLVAAAFSSGRPRALYLSAKAWIDRAAGAVLAALGVRLILESGRAA